MALRTKRVAALPQRMQCDLIIGHQRGKPYCKASGAQRAAAKRRRARSALRAKRAATEARRGQSDLSILVRINFRNMSIFTCAFMIPTRLKQSSITTRLLHEEVCTFPYYRNHRNLAEVPPNIPNVSPGGENPDPHWRGESCSAPPGIPGGIRGHTRVIPWVSCLSDWVSLWGVATRPGHAPRT